MVPQQAQRLRWEDDVDIYLWCDRGRVFFDDESIFFTSPCLSFRGRASISFLSSILSPAHLLVLFTLPMPDDFLGKLPFAFFCVLAGLAPLHAIKPLNNVFVLVNALLLLRHWTVYAYGGIPTH
jgi:hypothetical protein